MQGRAQRRKQGGAEGRAKDRGAVLVEAAFVIPIFALFLFGIIEFGSAYSDNVSLRQGVREGARQAVVGSYGTDSSCTTTGGSITGSNKQVACLTKSRIGLDPSATRVMLSLPGGYVAGQPALLCAQLPLKSMTGLLSPFLDGHFLRTKVEMRLEVDTGGTLSSFQETAPSGGDWAWCS